MRTVLQAGNMNMIAVEAETKSPDISIRHTKAGRFC